MPTHMQQLTRLAVHAEAVCPVAPNLSHRARKNAEACSMATKLAVWHISMLDWKAYRESLPAGCVDACRDAGLLVQYIQGEGKEYRWPQ